MRDLVIEYINGLTILDVHRSHNTISESDEHRLSELLDQIWAQLTDEEQMRVAKYIKSLLDSGLDSGLS
jgi:hypothetical protein